MGYYYEKHGLTKEVCRISYWNIEIKEIMEDIDAKFKKLG